MISMIGIISLFFFGSLGLISLQIGEFTAFSIFAVGFFLSLSLEAKFDVLIPPVKKTEQEDEQEDE